MVPLSEISRKANDFNLNTPATSTPASPKTCTTWPPTCVVASRTATSTLSAAYWKVFLGLRQLLPDPVGAERQCGCFQ